MKKKRATIWKNMVYCLYDLLLLIAGSLLIPYYHLRGLKYGKSRRGVRERLGFYLPEMLEKINGREVVWIHSVSVGETRAAIPLIKILRKTFPSAAIVLSNITETGHSAAQEISEIDVSIFLPFDLSWVVRRSINQIRPSLIVIIETEIWPNFICCADSQNVPVVLINGRISSKSYPRYRHIRYLMEPILQKFSALCMQSSMDAERISSLGAPPDRVYVTGNLKFDIEDDNQASSKNLVSDFKQILGNSFVWVAGSTHAGEEEIITDIYFDLIKENYNLVLVLVPRHPERCKGVKDMLDAKGFNSHLRNKTKKNKVYLQSGDILLVDTIGEMIALYGVADLVFIGGSLVPVGGHNVLEASLRKKPVIFGQYMENFKDISQRILQAEAGIQVSNVYDLKNTVCKLIDDNELRHQMGENGYKLLEKNRGATARSLGVIQKLGGLKG